MDALSQARRYHHYLCDGHLPRMDQLRAVGKHRCVRRQVRAGWLSVAADLLPHTVPRMSKRGATKSTNMHVRTRTGDAVGVYIQTQDVLRIGG